MYDNARFTVNDADRVSSLPSSVRHYVGLSRVRSREMTAHHLAADGVHGRRIVVLHYL